MSLAAETFSLTTMACRQAVHRECPGSFVLATPPLEGLWKCACPCHSGGRRPVVEGER